MKRYFKKVLGVTLLEIMLVLAIAAMVIVMSIRYYAAASNAQKINGAMNLLTAIMASTDQYLSANGDLPADAAAMTNYLPSGTVLNSPWGGPILIAPNEDKTSYNVTFPKVPANACENFILAATGSKTGSGANTKVTTASTCTTGSADIEFLIKS